MNHMNKSFKLICVMMALGLLVAGLPTGHAQAWTVPPTWIAQVPASPVAGETVRVWMNSDADIGEEAWVEYRISEEIYYAHGFKDTTSHLGANWYADIPAQSSGTYVQYRLFIRNEMGMTVYESPLNWSYTVAAAPTEPPCSTDCYVNVSIGSDSNPGNLTTPFKTIQKGIDSVGINGTVNVAAGSYTKTGAIEVNKAGVNLHLAAGTTIQNSSACFNVTANNVHIYADTPAAAKCVPTSGSNGIDVASGIESLRVVNLEFDGASGTVGTPAADGIHFAGTVTNLQIINNYFHGFAGDAIEFVGAPAGIVQDIQGNYFLANTGQGVKVPTGTTVNATYNSWGTYEAPSLTGVITSPNTHAELFITPVGNMEVLKDNTVEFSVKGKIQKLSGTEFELSYPPQLELVSAAANELIWDLKPSVDTTTTLGKIKVRLSTTKPQSGEAVDMLTLTFNAHDYAENLSLTFDEIADSFAMSPDLAIANQVSNYVYTYSLTGVNELDIIGLPVVTVTPADGPYNINSPIPVTVEVSNTNGGNHAGLSLAFTLPTGAVLEYYDDSNWVYVTSPFDLGNLSPNQTLTLQFQVTLPALGSNAIGVVLMNGETPLTSGSTTLVIQGNFSVLGTFAMQGRTFRGGISVSFKLGAYAPPAVLTMDQLLNNLSITLRDSGTYQITTNQPRYLNVTLDLAKTKFISADVVLSPLTLTGGNVTNELESQNTVDLADAVMVGDAYGDTGDPQTLLADANFDGKVNIQDLAMVGGNFDLTAEDAYTIIWNWVP